MAAPFGKLQEITDLSSEFLGAFIKRCTKEKIMNLYAGKQISVNQNARRLFPSGFARYAPNSLEDFKRVIRQDKTKEVKSILSNPENAKNQLISIGLEEIYVLLSGERESGKTIARNIHSLLFSFFGKYKNASQAELEEACKIELSKVIPGYEKTFERLMSTRTGNVFSHLKPHIEGINVSTILDIGAGEGEIGYMVASRLGKQVTLIDVVDYKSPGVPLPMELYDGKRLPYKDRQFDAVMANQAYHHAGEPLDLFAESVRVTNRWLIVLESIHFNEEHRQLNVLLDWKYGNVFEAGFDCTYNYQTPAGWTETFEKKGLRIEKIVDIGINWSVSPDYKYLFILSKKAE